MDSYGYEKVICGFGLSVQIRIIRGRFSCHGSAWGPVILPVFKTGGRRVCPVAGAFDSHTLPPMFLTAQGFTHCAPPRRC